MQKPGTVYMSVAHLPMFCIWLGWPGVAQLPVVQPGQSYVAPMGPDGHVGWDFIEHPQVHEPPLGPSRTDVAPELLKHDAAGFPPTKPTRVHPPLGTT
jgi:hypothetical protein